MKILQILPELNVGGVETGTVDLARRLVKLGHKAVVVSFGGPLVKELEAGGAIHYQLPVNKKSIFNILKMIPKLAAIIKKEEIDIVHARSRVPAWIAYFSCRKTGRPLITTCHGYYKKHYFSAPMGWGKLIICPSRVVARHMIDDFAVPHERIRLVPRCADLERFKYIDPAQKRKDKEFNVGIIGRITPIKGHLFFIKAMAKVARKVPYLKIWIVGDAPESKAAYKEQVQVLVKRLGLWDSTQFLGTQRDMPEIFRHLDLAVLASVTHDAFPRSIIEAQASGVPVVATSVGGVIDIIEDGKNGILVPAKDPNSMAEAAIKIFQDRQLAQNLAEEAYKKVKAHYSAEHLVENTFRVYEEALNHFRILLIKFSSLGDIILSTAAFKAIRKRFPVQKYKISLLVQEEARDLVARCPYIDELLICDLKNKDKGIRGLLNLGRELRKRNFDLAIDLQNNRKSHILSFLSMAQDRYGYDNKKFGFLLNHGIKDDGAPIGPLEHQFRILKTLGIEAEDDHLEIWPSEEDQLYIDEFLNSHWLNTHQKLVGINLSASPRWQSKNWPLNYVAALCEELAKHSLRLVITGTKEETEQAELLMDMIKNVKPINACAKTTLNQLGCLIKRCTVFISPDSAPLHIAASVNTPFVALFGPTDPRRHLPAAKNYLLLKKGLECSPCYKSKCKDAKCMQEIRPEEVLAAVLKLLK